MEIQLFNCIHEGQPVYLEPCSATVGSTATYSINSYPANTQNSKYAGNDIHNWCNHIPNGFTQAYSHCRARYLLIG